MEKQMIISIGREFGSAGHEIAEMVAKDLNLPLYDRSLLEHVAEEAGYDLHFLQKYDEKQRNPFLSRKVRGHSNSLEETVAELQFNYMKEHADAGESFVIVGRCSDVILKGQKGLITVFVLAHKKEKIRHIMTKYNLSESEAISKMKRHDSTRKAYHDSHTKHGWGNAKTYDLCINSSDLGVAGSARIIEEFAKEMIEARYK